MIGLILAGGAALAVTGYGLSRYKKRRRLKRNYRRWLDQRRRQRSDDGVGVFIADTGTDSLLWLDFMNVTAGGTDFSAIDNFEGKGGSFGGGGATGSWDDTGTSVAAVAAADVASESHWTDYVPDIPEISLPDISLPDIDISLPDIDIDLS